MMWYDKAVPTHLGCKSAPPVKSESTEEQETTKDNKRIVGRHLNYMPQFRHEAA